MKLLIIVITSLVGYLGSFLLQNGGNHFTALGFGFVIGLVFSFFVPSKEKENNDLLGPLQRMLLDPKLAQKGTDEARVQREYAVKAFSEVKEFTSSFEFLRKNLIPMLFQLRLIDDSIDASETHTLHKIFAMMGFSSHQISHMEERLQGLSQHSFDPYDLARQFASMSEGEKVVLMECLYRVSFADDEFKPSEEAFLRQIASVFGLDEAWFVLKSVAGRSQVHKAFEKKKTYSGEEARWILGLSSKSSSLECEETYEKLFSFYQTATFPFFAKEFRKFHQLAVTDLQKAIATISPLFVDKNNENKEETEEVVAHTTPIQSMPVEEVAKEIVASLHLPPNQEISVVQKEVQTVDNTAQKEESFASVEKRKALFVALKSMDKKQVSAAVQELLLQGTEALDAVEEQVDDFLMRDAWVEYFRLLGPEYLGFFERLLLTEKSNYRDWLLEPFLASCGEKAKPVLQKIANGESFLMKTKATHLLEKK